MVDTKKTRHKALDKAWDPILDTIQNPIFADIIERFEKIGH